MIMEKLCIEGLKVIRYKYGSAPDISILIQLKQQQSINLNNQLKEMKGKLEDLDSQLKKKEQEFKTNFYQDSFKTYSRGYASSRIRESQNQSLGSLDTKYNTQNSSQRKTRNMNQQSQNKIQRLQRGNNAELMQPKIKQLSEKDPRTYRKYKYGEQSSSHRYQQKKNQKDPQVCNSSRFNTPIISPYKSMDVSVVREPDLKDLSFVSLYQSATKQTQNPKISKNTTQDNNKQGQQNEYINLMRQPQENWKNLRSKSSQSHQSNIQAKREPERQYSQRSYRINKNSEGLYQKANQTITMDAIKYGNENYRPYSLAMALANFN